MKSINHVRLLGRLGDLPELMMSKNGRSYLRIRICTDHSVKQEDGSFEEVPTWHTVWAWGKLADTCARHLVKGQRVHVDGHLTYWREDAGKLTNVGITAEEMIFLDRPKSLGAAADLENVDNREAPRNHNAVAHPALRTASSP
jgi:single-strand DNA-binding protein